MENDERYKNVVCAKQTIIVKVYFRLFSVWILFIAYELF